MERVRNGTEERLMDGKYHECSDYDGDDINRDDYDNDDAAEKCQQKIIT